MTWSFKSRFAKKKKKLVEWPVNSFSKCSALFVVYEKVLALDVLRKILLFFPSTDIFYENFADLAPFRFDPFLRSKSILSDSSSPYPKTPEYNKSADLENF
jgi:hypothetical protein